MEIYLDKNKIEEILRLYYSNITKQECQIVIETSVEYYDGRYNEVEERLIICPKITVIKNYLGQDFEITKTIDKKYVEDTLAIFLKDELPSIDNYDYKFKDKQFEGITIKSYEKEKKYRLNNFDD